MVETSSLYGCRAFLPILRRERAAQIVNVASDLGLLGTPGKTAYCATKFAVRGFSEALGAELLGSSIGVTCVYPSAVDTSLIRNSRAVDAARRELEARFVASRGLPAGRVAERIIRAIERRQSRVLIGRDTYLIDALSRISPALANRLAAAMSHRLPFV